MYVNLINLDPTSLTLQMLFSIQKDISRQILELQQLHSVKSTLSCLQCVFFLFLFFFKWMYILVPSFKYCWGIEELLWILLKHHWFHLLFSMQICSIQVGFFNGGLSFYNVGTPTPSVLFSSLLVVPIIDNIALNEFAKKWTKMSSLLTRNQVNSIYHILSSYVISQLYNFPLIFGFIWFKFGLVFAIVACLITNFLGINCISLWEMNFESLKECWW